MQNDLIGKATFSEVYRFLKGKPDGDVFQCFKSLFGVALLFFPALIGGKIVGAVLNMELINGLATGATLAGAGVGALVSRAAGDAFKLFNGKGHGDYATRYDQMQIAQILLVYAAYFDTISQYLPDENGEIALSPDAKRKISQDGFQRYLKTLEEASRRQKDTHRLLDTEFVLPNPTQKFSLYREELRNFYVSLNAEFMAFFESLSFWEELNREEDALDREQKRFFTERLQKLPDIALDTYEKQYFELAREFPEFAVWANHTEHVRLEERIDIGFKQIAGQLQELYAGISQGENHAPETLAHYYTRYSDSINGSIIEEKKDDFDEEIVFPPKKDIFIPQAFQALAYRKSMQLEQNDTWKDAYAGEEIGPYIRNILCHPKYGELPMLILGLPGAGKTLLCHMLAARILSAEYYVIIIRLRDAIAEDTIMKQIDAQIDGDLGEKCTWDDLRRAPLDKPLLLIFDGYDELLQASGKTYSNYINKIAEFQAEQRSIYHVCVRCIITSRLTLIDKASIPGGCQVLRLCDFDSARVRAWCEIWNGANERYFRAHGLTGLEIAPTGKISELAGQPLLLLMLALYDINGNSLQEQKEISRAELYYRLVRDFVKRERRKDAVFNQLTPGKQEREIRAGFRNLGIVALGMFNRKKLYIRTSELNRDIAFLTAGGSLEEDTDENALEEADKRVAGFFFVYSSCSTVQKNGITSRIAAYEFLHNTFGEFLTAYFILDVTFRLIKRQIMDSEQEEAFSWPGEMKKEWHTALAYAPLFTRPVVLNMIHELSEIFAGESNLEATDVRKALDSLFCGEIRRIISGEFFAELSNTLNMQGNPFRHPELMMHVGVYSINLVLLRLTVCSEDFTFTGTPDPEQDWKKLTHIWRYAFSEEELVNLSCLMKLYHSDKEIKLRYNFDEEATGRAGSFSKLGRLRQVSAVLGDDAARAVFSVFDTSVDFRILEILEREDLGLTTQYFLNMVVNMVSAGIWGKELTDLLNRLLQSCIKEKNIMGLCAYCVTVGSLNGMELLGTEDIRRLLNGEIFQVMSMIIAHRGLDQGWPIKVLIVRETLKIISDLPNGKRNVLIDSFIEYFAYEIRNMPVDVNRFLAQKCIADLFLIFTKTMQNTIEKCRLKNLGKRYFMGLRRMEQMGGLLTWREMNAVMWLCRALRKIGDVRTGNEIFDYCICRFYMQNQELFMKPCNPSCLSSLIECCYYLKDDIAKGHSEMWCQPFFRRYAGIEDIANRLLPGYERAFGCLITLICYNIVVPKQIWGDSSGELQRTVKRFGDQLSFNTLKRIKEYGEAIHNKSICAEADRALSRNRQTEQW